MDNGQPKYDINQLADRWRKGTITPEEKAYYEQWYHAFDDSKTAVPAEVSGPAEEIGNRIYQRLAERLHPSETPKIRRLFTLRRIAVAASVLLCCSIAFYIYRQAKQKPKQIAENHKQAILPGRNQATLTLGNGQTIVLTKKLNGQIAIQGQTAIRVNKGDAITYISQPNTQTSTVAYNTMSTVRGEESPYALVLSDGTRVWLNAASSITYPVSFNGNERDVKITGEAYFEIAHNARQPFKIQVKGQIIEDIGTSFNINAYDDEPVIKTTLFTGSARVAKNGESAVLKPGQEAVTTTDGGFIKVRNVDTEGALAWKNGYFLFDHESLESIMRKISRWYDVDVVYEPGQNFQGGFLGSMTRYANISQVLNALEAAGNVKFKIEGRKVIVRKK